MTEIHKNLFVGNETDYEFKVRNQEDWSVIQACKEPYHRQALGYRGRGVPKGHPEYLMAKRETDCITKNELGIVEQWNSNTKNKGRLSPLRGNPTNGTGPISDSQPI